MTNCLTTDVEGIFHELACVANRDRPGCSLGPLGTEEGDGEILFARSLVDRFISREDIEYRGWDPCPLPPKETTPSPSDAQCGVPLDPEPVSFDSETFPPGFDIRGCQAKPETKP